MQCLSYYLLCSLFNKIGKQEGKTGSALKPGWGVAQTMYIHVSKCKNGKKILQTVIHMSFHACSKALMRKIIKT
jgi:hypothetical protein